MYTFKVNGMGCGSCVNKITQAIQNQDHAAKVFVNLPNRVVTVESAEPETIILTIIQKLGFNASLATRTHHATFATSTTKELRSYCVSSSIAKT
jgi:copper chaperone